MFKVGLNNLLYHTNHFILDFNDKRYNATAREKLHFFNLKVPYWTILNININIIY